MSHQPNHGKPGKGLSTELNVGESLVLVSRATGSELVFNLESKGALAEIAKEFAPRGRGQVDSVKIVLTIEARHGQRARVKVQADESVRINRPPKVAA
ncbi:MAG: hypothetical protein EOP38_26665 [Rubrivivax sp.]|nr:MAG: hypothetical protein EOP38_26665 [Rubrivivax sp.]